MKDARPGAPRAMPGIAPSAGRDHRHLTIDEIIGESRHLIVMTLRPAVFDRHVPALDRLLQACRNAGKIAAAV
jgi:hypothetical protein